MRLLSTIVLSAALLMTAAAEAQTAHAWATSATNQRALPDRQFAETAAAAQCLTPDASQQYQTIDGFGWMLNEGSAMLIKSRLFSSVRSDLLRELYSPEEGLGASIVRISIGASDVSEADYTYSPSEDPTLSNFSLEGPDLRYVIPVLKEILQINPEVKVMAVPWTAPVWMKTGTQGNGGYKGGSLAPEHYDTYARYFVKYLQAMEAEGIRIWAITPQNEPLHGGNNPSMVFTKETEFSFVDSYLGPILAENGFGDVKIIGYDHNCDNTDFPTYVAQSQYVSGSAFHLYGGNVSAMRRVYDATGKDVYFTEQYTGANGDPAGDFNWHMNNVMLGSVLNMSRCAIEWNLAADVNNGPHTDGGCTECKGALTIGTNQVSARNVSYYIVGAMSKVVRPGAKRIATSGAPNFKHAAFHNPDGSLAIVAYNNASSQQQFSVKLGDKVVSWAVAQGNAISVLVPDAFLPFDTALEPVEPSAFDADTPACDLLGRPVAPGFRGIVIQGKNKFILQQ